MAGIRRAAARCRRPSCALRNASLLARDMPSTEPIRSIPPVSAVGRGVGTTTAAAVAVEEDAGDDRIPPEGAASSRGRPPRRPTAAARASTQLPAGRRGRPAVSPPPPPPPIPPPLPPPAQQPQARPASPAPQRGAPSPRAVHVGAPPIAASPQRCLQRGGCHAQNSALSAYTCRPEWVPARCRGRPPRRPPARRACACTKKLRGVPPLKRRRPPRRLQRHRRRGHRRPIPAAADRSCGQ